MSHGNLRCHLIWPNMGGPVWSYLDYMEIEHHTRWEALFNVEGYYCARKDTVCCRDVRGTVIKGINSFPQYSIVSEHLLHARYCANCILGVQGWQGLIWDHWGFTFSWGNAFRLSGCCCNAMWLGVCVHCPAPSFTKCPLNVKGALGVEWTSLLQVLHLFQVSSSPWTL